MAYDKANGWEAIHQAVFETDIKKIKAILEKQSDEIEAVTNAGLTPLHMAVKKRNLLLVKLFIKHDADIDAQDNKGFSPLYYAVTTNQVKIARFLLNHDANPNLANNSGNVPIHNIAYRNRFELLELFTNYKTNFKQKNRLGMLASDFAKKNGHGAMAYELKQLEKYSKE